MREEEEDPGSIPEGGGKAPKVKSQKKKMGTDNTPAVKSEDNLTMFQSKDAQLSLPKHSYWFDFWAFLLFDIVFFLFMYFIVP